MHSAQPIPNHLRAVEEISGLVGEAPRFAAPRYRPSRLKGSRPINRRDSRPNQSTSYKSSALFGGGTAAPARTGDLLIHNQAL